MTEAIQEPGRPCGWVFFCLNDRKLKHSATDLSVHTGVNPASRLYEPPSLSGEGLVEQACFARRLGYRLSPNNAVSSCTEQYVPGRAFRHALIGRSASFQRRWEGGRPR